ncbi:MAG: hypothetical protein JW849_10510 [Phycisphaerae bacterium]|nr:hypothetical protein [Phycisphaerae bacterium]
MIGATVCTQAYFLSPSLATFLASSDSSVTSAWFFGLLAVNILGNIIVGFVSFVTRRSVSDHDKADKSRDERIEKLETMIAQLGRSLSDERDARHADMKEQADRLWQFSGEVRESYLKRHEGLRLFGSIARRVEKGTRELMDRIENLPCTQTHCPSQEMKPDV